MFRGIQQVDLALIHVKDLKNNTVLVKQGTQDIVLNKKGADALIKVLREWVDND